MQVLVTRDSSQQIVHVEIDYWSVYEQRWKTALSQIDIPDREMAAMPQSDRDKVAKYLPAKIGTRHPLWGSL